MLLHLLQTFFYMDIIYTVVFRKMNYFRSTKTLTLLSSRTITCIKHRHMIHVGLFFKYKIAQILNNFHNYLFWKFLLYLALRFSFSISDFPFHLITVEQNVSSPYFGICISGNQLHFWGVLSMGYCTFCLLDSRFQEPLVTI